MHLRAAELANLPEDVAECEALAEAKGAEAEQLCLGDRGTLHRYTTLVADVEQLTKESERKEAVITKLQVYIECTACIVSH